MRISGRVIKLGHDVDTDRIIPARYCNSFAQEDLAPHALEDYDPGLANKIRPGDVIVAGENFGCGSSREHAPVALLGAGIRCIVAVSFARIFYRNALNLGLPVLVCEHAFDVFENFEEIVVETGAGKIIKAGTGDVLRARPLSRIAGDLMRAGGLASLVRAMTVPGREPGD
ncbi:MAG: 3-isopropylmalate dehydratase small subunit [Deltaproteobacteria bacterium]|nr:3-isopropylmalate dehydratase small subunit [Deltaproteobacteria bacterium]